jgi:Uma2 family endonuclease
MNWQEICDTPIFRDLPFKLETNKWGKIEMSPASNEHGLYQVALIECLLKYSDIGRPIAECSVQTAEGVKVADVAFGSFDFFRRNRRANPYRESPEIVIEILSPSNTAEEMQEKRGLYFSKGALEFWICDGKGNLRFFDKQGETGGSDWLQGVPKALPLDFA